MTRRAPAAASLTAGRKPAAPTAKPTVVGPAASPAPTRKRPAAENTKGTERPHGTGESKATETLHAPADLGRAVPLDEAIEFAAAQVRRLVTAAPGRTATYTDHGRWVLDADGWAPGWTGGFLAGQLWLQAAAHPADPFWREQAERYTAALESRAHDRGTHDIGFLLEPSVGRLFDATGDPHARDILIAGGRTMAGRLQPAGGYLSTWVDPGSTFIDVMMNVGIVFRAAELSGNDDLAAAALSHCRVSRRFLVRGDGSTVHEGWFDTTTGEFLRAATHQGWRADSSWARGQAWAIYGFAEAYRHTGEADLLRTARCCADFYLRRTGERYVPPNDWDDPAPSEPWESSAASVAAAGMLRLARELDRAAAGGPGGAAAAYPPGRRYRDYAAHIVETLCRTEFLAIDEPGWEGVIRHASYHHGNRLGVDESVMWGDYYFLEAASELAARSAPAEAPARPVIPDGTPASTPAPARTAATAPAQAPAPAPAPTSTQAQAHTPK